MAINGIPLPASVNHESNIYPGIIADWERDPLVFHPSQPIETLFRVDVSGVFLPPPFLEYVTNGTTNKWKIEHVGGMHPSEHRTSFTMIYASGYPTLNSKMRMYKAAVELEDLLLRRTLPFADNEFDIEVTSCSRDDFIAKFSGEEGDSSNEFTAEWLNVSTMHRVYTWITTVVPTFVQCWMPDSKVRELEAYDTISGQSQNGEQALMSSNNNLLLVVVTPTGGTATVVIQKDKFEDKPGKLRHACKMQTMELNVNPERILRHTKLLDMQYLGTTQQVLVRKTLANFRGEGRVFCVFPSFDEFPGLLSRGAEENASSRLHCNMDPTDANGNFVSARTVFRTSGITQCPGEDLVEIEVDTCQSSGSVFRVRKPRGCPDVYFKPWTDPTCCEMHFDSIHGQAGDAGDELRIYGNRTVDSSRQRLHVLNDAYDWFATEFGVEGPISLVTDDFASEPTSWKAFKHFLPNCHTLHLHFWTDEGLNRAIEFMRLATGNNLVYDAIFTVKYQPTFEKCLELLKVFPQNKTEIVFPQVEDALTAQTIIRLDTWVQTLENKRVDIRYRSAEVLDDDGNRIRYHNYKRVKKTMVRRGYTVVFGMEEEVTQLRKDHVELTIDSNRDHHAFISGRMQKVYTTTLRFRAGTKHRRVAMKENRKSTRKRKGSESAS